MEVACTTTGFRASARAGIVVGATRKRRSRLILPLLSLLFGTSLPISAADTFRLPTANQAIYEAGHEDKFFVPTPGKTWISGTFGCVRTEGWQLHEGLDIKCLQRDRHNEPTDSVMATADGTVAYVNTQPSLSNYGNYIILRHQIDGMEICSLYAHLREVRAGLASGHSVKAGEIIATMGRTSNTKQKIGIDRAHVHFELDFVMNERYAAWHKSAIPGERNDHGDWNGKNLLGIDPRAVLIAQHNAPHFSLRQFLASQPELCRVLVHQTNFSWLRRYPMLVRPNPLAEKEGVAAYELALTFNGVPFQLTPRAASEIKTKDRFHLLSVNQREHQDNPCGRLVTNQRGRWQLTSHGIELLQLLTY
jgi:murein DD-endopeptidase MepM/ murein hydrolase activator NlpD